MFLICMIVTLFTGYLLNDWVAQMLKTLVLQEINSEKHQANGDQSKSIGRTYSKKECFSAESVGIIFIVIYCGIE